VLTVFLIVILNTFCVMIFFTVNNAVYVFPASYSEDIDSNII